MPTHIDTTYHNRLSEPVFDSKEEEIRYQRKREDNFVFEIAPPPVPTRQQELDYMEWLTEDWRSDRWLTTRFRKLTPNPKRVPWKNSIEITR